IVSDDSGNKFSVGPPTGLPVGLTIVTLKANTTVASANFLVTSGATIAANLTMVYSVRHQFCYPSGLGFDVIGSTEWGLQSSGTLGLPFLTKPISVVGYRASFENKSGPRLGFDWSDSKSSSPSYSSETNSLDYQVNNSISIDPATVGTSK